MEKEGHKFLKTNKGGDKLIYKGYAYNVNRKDSTTTFWRCEQGRKKKTGSKKQDTTCSGSAKTELINGVVQVLEGNEHNHSSVPYRESVVEARNKAKDLAKTRIKPSQVIQEVTASSSAEITPYLPGKNAMQLLVKREQKKFKMKEPKTLQEVDFPMELTRTIEGSDFAVSQLIEGDDAIIIFMSRESLRYLHQAEYWISDGTFSTVPTILYQLYTIHGKVGRGEHSHVFPLAYCLLSGKSEQLYVTLFQEIQRFADSCDMEIETKLFITDFERAAINGFKSVFPNAEVNGCYFHFKQCLMKKLDKLGLRNRYCTNMIFWLDVNKLAALAFLPPEDIPSAFAELLPFLPSDPQFTEFLDYIDNTWVRGQLLSITSRGTERRSPVMYPPALWSVASRTELGIPRTQNIVESWHNRINTIIDRSHVGLYTLVEYLRKEEHQVHGTIKKLFNGTIINPTPPSLREREERIKTIIANKSSYETVEFLEALASNLSL